MATTEPQETNGVEQKPVRRRQTHGARLHLPFENRHKDAGEWAYDHRVGLSVMIICYLVLGIVFVSSKIILNDKPHLQGHIYRPSGSGDAGRGEGASRTRGRDEAVAGEYGLVVGPQPHIERGSAEREPEGRPRHPDGGAERVGARDSRGYGVQPRRLRGRLGRGGGHPRRGPRQERG